MCVGSSPLTRGKLGSPRSQPPCLGLIPAHAGKTQFRAGRCSTRTAHPRSRGENHGVHVEGNAHDGSSPLTRGKRRVHRKAEALCGLIPAHAGKTRSIPTPGTGTRAHPRSRGENSRSICPRIDSSGSSPLTRGKLNVAQLLADGVRLIPAHAGKTSDRSGWHP